MEHLLTQKVDILVTDYQMPGLDGLELAEVAKSRGVGKVLMVSGYFQENPGFREKIEKMGIVTMGKPFRREEILGKVK
jgi:CheY-like chemotaxis protein